MMYELIIAAAILLGLAGLGLAIRYYNERKTPTCKQFKKTGYGNTDNEVCPICDSNEQEPCGKEQ